MAKQLNPNRVKIHRNYTVEDTACLLSVHKNTVRNWINKGLPILDDLKPYLILGIELKLFLQSQRSSKKQKCKPDEMYCMRCKSPQRPAENMVDYEPINTATGRLIALCSGCGSIMNKYSSHTSLSKLSNIFEIIFPSAEKHINKRINLPLNSYFNNRG